MDMPKPQKVNENGKVPYAWNFDSLGISYFEIPKTGSSSTKTLLFNKNFGLDEEAKLDIAKGRLKHRFSEAMIRNFGSEDMLERVLVIYRNPITRAKSVYRHVFLRMHRLEGSMSEYFENYFEEFLRKNPQDSLFNHHKPMTWFFPKHLINDSRSIFWETEKLNELPKYLGLDEGNESKSQTKMPHLLDMYKNGGDIDMTDEEIRTALGPAFDDDFEFYENVK